MQLQLQVETPHVAQDGRDTEFVKPAKTELPTAHSIWVRRIASVEILTWRRSRLWSSTPARLVERRLSFRPNNHVRRARLVAYNL